MTRPTRQPVDAAFSKAVASTQPPVSAAPALPEQSPYPHPDWMEWLSDEWSKPYFKQLLDRLTAAGKTSTVYPPASDRYTALKQSPSAVKVVILGQDPYHGARQAHGLSFSVRPGVRIPPSLANIYREIENEGLGKAEGRDGCLTGWAQQGVLLLNNVLTVEAGMPGSHRGWGWEKFTDAIVSLLNERREGLVFLLWGRDAASKAEQVDTSKHLVLKSPHPSPYSANSGFFGNGHFKKTNEWLVAHGQQPIRW